MCRKKTKFNWKFSLARHRHFFVNSIICNCKCESLFGCFIFFFFVCLDNFVLLHLMTHTMHEMKMLRMNGKKLQWLECASIYFLLRFGRFYETHKAINNCRYIYFKTRWNFACLFFITKNYLIFMVFSARSEKH